MQNMYNMQTMENMQNMETYLIFVIFVTRAKFLEKKIYTEKRVNYDKVHSKLPMFALLRQNTQ